MEDYKEKYELALDAVQEILNSDSDLIMMSRLKLRLQSVFPELKESEDEKIRNCIGMCLTDANEQRFKDYNTSLKECLDWLEKQGSITKLSEEEEKELAKSVLTSCATSFINYLDAHKYEGKMCVSNGECEDIENSFLNAMWDRLHRYYCKYIEKQDEQKPTEWNILSAKKGDILSNGTIVLIVDSIEEFEGKHIINSWYFADSEKFYGKGTSECDRWEVDDFRTATEAECNYLLKMMTDAGYVWDTNKLELMEIEQKSAWSEDDEHLLLELQKVISLSRDVEWVDMLSAWLKSVKYRCIWKPTKEHVKAVRLARSFVTDDFGEHPMLSETLIDLEEQLNKLREK